MMHAVQLVLFSSSVDLYFKGQNVHSGDAVTLLLKPCGHTLHLRLLITSANSPIRQLLQALDAMNALYFPLGQLLQLADLASGCARPSGQYWQEIELSEALM